MRYARSIRIYEFIVFVNLYFRPSTSKRKASVFKNDLHSGERVSKDPFSVTVFTGNGWTVGQTGEKKTLRFQTKTDACRRGLRRSH